MVQMNARKQTEETFKNGHSRDTDMVTLGTQDKTKIKYNTEN